jgi:3-hydroxyisobutyrate dehydrogenase-like beta-hydroxyacid dehydrogenase
MQNTKYETYIRDKEYLTKERKNIGFIGLGKMGAAMAGHLAKSGNKVTIFNRSEKKISDWMNCFSGLNVKVAKDLAEIAETCETIVSCVGNDNDLKNITVGDKGCFRFINKKTLFIDHTTTSCTVSKEIFIEAKKKNIYFFDAPVSGGTEGAKNGLLSVMYGGESGLDDEVKEVLSPYAKTVIQIGEAGTGQLAKMVNQICIAGLIQSLAEGIKFGQEAKLDMEKVLNVISNGAAQSWQMENRGYSMLAGKYNFGFAVDLMLKDLNIVMDQARLQNSQLEITQKVKQFYENLSLNGCGDFDTSALLHNLSLQKDNQVDVNK